MFTWICPQCGRECPPSYTECPDCAGGGEKKAAEGPAANPSVSAPAPAATPVSTAAVAQAPSPAAAPVRMPAPVPPPNAGLPTWALGIVFAFAFFGVVMAGYLVYGYYHKPAGEAAKPAAPAETASRTLPAAPAHPYLKHVEITGWRLLQNARKEAEIRFIVVNHSGAEIPDLAATVNLRAHAGVETEPIGLFRFKLPSLGPYESKDLTARLETKLKVYEFPDWQNLFEEIQINTPVK